MRFSLRQARFSEKRSTFVEILIKIFAMKIVHTSDWHLGHTLYNYDRTEEQQAMLLQLTDLVREEQPDLFLLCGDVYHTSQPSAAVQTLFTNALMALHEACPGMTIVATAGNHDSSTKHEIFSTPWRSLKVHTIGCIDVTRKEELIVELPGRGYVIAVPYVNERNMPKGLLQELLDAVSERNKEQLPVILSAHTTVRGCDFTGHEQATERTVGGIDAYALEEMGSGYDYLALGHIHHAQFVHGGEHRVRYSGTPLPVSFDECYPHTISVVELGAHGDIPSVREVAIHNPHPLVTLPADGVATWEEAKEMLGAFPDDLEAYIRLNVEVDDFLPAEAQGEAHQLVEGKKCRFCVIQTHRLHLSPREAKVMSVQEFKTEAPIDIAMRYAQDIGVTFDDDLKELFCQTLEAVREEDRR